MADPGFPRRGTNPSEGRQPTIWPFFPENCMKMKKFWHRGGTSLAPSRSATGCGNYVPPVCISGQDMVNKKVLLLERKRHTARKRAQDADPPQPLTEPNPRLDLTPQLDLTPPPPLADWPDPPPVGWLTWPSPSADWPDPPPPIGSPDLTPGDPPTMDKLTKWNYYLPVVLRTRAVIKAGIIGRYG